MKAGMKRWTMHVLALVVVALSLLLPSPGGAQVAGPDAWTLHALTVAAEQYGVPFRELYVTAECESGSFRPDVVYGPTLGALGEKGMMQLHPRGKLIEFYAVGYSDPFDPVQAADYTAWAFSRGQQYHWSCWRLRWRGW